MPTVRQFLTDVVKRGGTPKQVDAALRSVSGISMQQVIDAKMLDTDMAEVRTKTAKAKEEFAKLSPLLVPDKPIEAAQRKGLAAQKLADARRPTLKAPPVAKVAVDPFSAFGGDAPTTVAVGKKPKPSTQVVGEGSKVGTPVVPPTQPIGLRGSATPVGGYGYTRDKRVFDPIGRIVGMSVGAGEVTAKSAAETAAEAAIGGEKGRRVVKSERPFTKAALREERDLRKRATRVYDTPGAIPTAAQFIVNTASDAGETAGNLALLFGEVFLDQPVPAGSTAYGEGKKLGKELATGAIGGTAAVVASPVDAFVARPVSTSLDFIPGAGGLLKGVGHFARKAGGTKVGKAAGAAKSAAVAKTLDNVELARQAIQSAAESKRGGSYTQQQLAKIYSVFDAALGGVIDGQGLTKMKRVFADGLAQRDARHAALAEAILLDTQRATSEIKHMSESFQKQHAKKRVEAERAEPAADSIAKAEREDARIAEAKIEGEARREREVGAAEYKQAQQASAAFDKFSKEAKLRAERTAREKAKFEDAQGLLDEQAAARRKKFDDAEAVADEKLAAAKEKLDSEIAAAQGELDRATKAGSRAPHAAAEALHTELAAKTKRLADGVSALDERIALLRRDIAGGGRSAPQKQKLLDTAVGRRTKLAKELKKSHRATRSAEVAMNKFTEDIPKATKKLEALKERRSRVEAEGDARTAASLNKLQDMEAAEAARTGKSLDKLESIEAAEAKRAADSVESRKKLDTEMSEAAVRVTDAEKKATERIAERTKRRVDDEMPVVPITVHRTGVTASDIDTAPHTVKVDRVKLTGKARETSDNIARRLEALGADPTKTTQAVDNLWSSTPVQLLRHPEVRKRVEDLLVKIIEEEQRGYRKVLPDNKGVNSRDLAKKILDAVPIGSDAALDIFGSNVIGGKRMSAEAAAKLEAAGKFGAGMPLSSIIRFAVLGNEAPSAWAKMGFAPTKEAKVGRRLRAETAQMIFDEAAAKAGDKAVSIGIENEARRLFPKKDARLPDADAERIINDMVSGKAAPVFIPGDRLPNDIAEAIRVGQEMLQLKANAAGTKPAISKGAAGRMARRIEGFKKMDPKLNLGDVWADPGMKSSIEWHVKSRKSLSNDPNIQKFISGTKGNYTARNASSIINNVVSNTGMQMTRRGITNPTKYFNDMRKAMNDWEKFIADPASLPIETRRMMEDIQSVGLFDSNALKADIGTLRNGGFFSDMGARVPGSKKAEGLFELGDAAFKMEEAVYQYKKWTKALEDLTPGHSLDMALSPRRTARVHKNTNGTLSVEIFAGNKSMGKLADMPGGSGGRLGRLKAKASAKPGFDLMFAYDDTAMGAKIMRTLPITGIGSTFFTWVSKAVDIPFFKKGLGHHIMADPDAFKTTDPKLILRQMKKSAALSARRALIVNGLRNAVEETKSSQLSQALRWTTNDQKTALVKVLANGRDAAITDMSYTNFAQPSQLFLNGLASTLLWVGGPKFKDVYPKGGPDLSKLDMKGRRRVMRLRELLMKDQTGQMGKLSDALDLIGLSGGPVASVWARFKEAGDAGRAMTAEDGIRLLGPLLLGGSTARAIDIAGAAAQEAGLVHPASKLTTRDPRRAEDVKQEEEFLKWAVRRFTGKGIQVVDLQKKSSPKEAFGFYQKAYKTWMKSTDTGYDIQKGKMLIIKGRRENKPEMVKEGRRMYGSAIRRKAIIKGVLKKQYGVYVRLAKKIGAKGFPPTLQLDKEDSKGAKEQDTPPSGD